MKKDDEGAIIGCLIVFLSLPFSMVWSGYVLSVLWTWFIVATFEARPLSIPAAIGISMVVRYLTYQWNVKEPEYTSQTTRAATALFMSFAYPAFALLFGAIVHQFM